MSRFAQKIVAATDFSEASELALSAAAILARQNGAQLFVVHVHVPVDTSSLLEDPRSGLLMPDDETRRRLHADLDALVGRILPEATGLHTAVATSRAPAAGLVHYADHVDADLIVVATHGRSGIRRLVLGSVAEEVVRTANCPVLTLRSKAKQ
jgi:nucleotide-binding universal stress UspA family protein